MAAKSKPTDDTLHALALAQFKFVAEVEHAQRESEVEALKFEAGDMWPADAKASRSGLPANSALGTPAVPARPMRTMRTLDQPLAQISSMARDADLGIRIIPKDGDARKEDAEVFAGLIRAIESDSHAQGGAYAIGFQRMRSCGRGYWRVNKAYASDEGGTDQVLRIDPIRNGGSVYMDPMPTWQAGGGFWEPDWCFVTDDISEARYQREYGKSKLACASDGEVLEALGDNLKNWVIDTEDGGKYYRIAEYFYAVYTDRALDEKDAYGNARVVRDRRIMWCKLNGYEILDGPHEWDGKYIPVIQDTGNTYNVNGTPVYEGMIQPNIGPCRMLNLTVSSAAEKMGKTTLSPWIAIAGQFQGYEAWWDQANTRNFSKLEYNATTAKTGQQILPPPMRNNEDPQIGSHLEMIGVFTNFIRSTTGVPDAALGHVNANDKSGKAIAQLQRAAEQGASNWLGYHANAIRHTGVVLVELIPSIYDAPGRVERILGTDGTPQSVMLNAPFIRDEQGQPKPAPTGMLASLGNGIKTAIGAKVPTREHHDLSKGQYSVIVTVGKSQETRRQEANTGMGALAQAAPELVPRFADIWVRNMDIPEADAIADRIKPPGVDDPNSLPPAAQAQIAQLQEALKQAQELANKNVTDLRKTVVQEHGETQRTEMKLSAQSEQAAKDREVKLAVAELGAKVDRLTLFLEERARLGSQAHELGMAAMAHEHSKDLAAQSADHAQQQSVTDAALQPPAQDEGAQPA